MKTAITILLLLLLFVASASAQTTKPPVETPQTKRNVEPDAAQIVSSDIALFWKAYDLARPENNLIVFRDEYLRKGSIGLQQFTRLRIGSSCALIDAIEQHPKYYASLRERASQLPSQERALRESFRKLKNLYDSAVFPDVYFLMGRMNSAGTLTDKVLLIGIDMFGQAADTPLDELGEWHKANIKPIEAVPFVVAHELIHYQQKYPRDQITLLQQTINEGGADFIAKLIAGGHGNERLHTYGDLHQKELWFEFKKEMLGSNQDNWLYQGDKAKNRPADLGYYIGYKICEAYYEKARDKKRAIKEILEIKDFQAFLTASGYAERFRN